MVPYIPANVSGLAGSISSIAAAGFDRVVSRRPTMPTDPAWYAPNTHVSEQFGESSSLRAVFLGVATVALTDGDTTLIFDGFFSRPPISTIILGKVQPLHKVIDEVLRRTNIEAADAVLVAHSHYDHALDAPAVAWRTGAKLVGSESTLNIGRGFGLADSSLQLVDLDKPARFGNFTVTSILSEHSPKPKFTGFIEAPLHAPARASDYRVGECYSFLVTHTAPGERPQRMLMHASAGFAPDCLAGHRADVAFLGMAPIGKQPASYREQYWDQTVATVGARRVFATHWDDFTKPLTEPLVPLPYFADNFATTLDFLSKKKQSSGVEVLIPEAFAVIDPFADLPSHR